ncbi:MAG: LysR family transcriptional regulator, partial [Gemmatimonadota bacterium]
MAETPRRLPSLDLLKGFESAARHLNFTHAADELYLTQSAVSRQIQTLEESLGVKLFIRQRRGLVLTAEGQRLREGVQAALSQLRDAIESLTPRSAPRGVTVTSTMAFSSLWLIPRLGKFQQLHPDVDVRIAANDRVLDLDREHIDVSVRYISDETPPPDGQWLFQEELV